MIRYVITVLAVFVFGVRAWAQNSPPHHTVSSTKVIEGSANPELIPDSTAFRLWFIAVSVTPDATEQERNVQQAHLGKIHLQDALDYVKLQTILSGFKVQYSAFIQRFNQAAETAEKQGVAFDPIPFLQQRDDLVSATRTAIATQLTANGAAKLVAHVQSEKRYMTTSETPKGGAQ